MNTAQYQVAVIGGGPAGLAAALAAEQAGARVLLVEREARPGGILKQCIHDGFGLLRFGAQLTGPEYAHRFLTPLAASGVESAVQTFVSAIARTEEGFSLTLVSRTGVRVVTAGALVLATGCRERTARQIGVHGRHCAGILTAGAAQYYTNILGRLPARRCVILGSGDIGLIMARRLTLEGAQVLGVYEAKAEPGGLTRNLYQCLEDYHIPLHTGVTVTRTFGGGRLEGVELSAVDARMTPIPGTEQRLACDGLILSVGLIPENELAVRLHVPLDPRTHGPVTDQTGMTAVPGVFSCGNALHVNDLVDYVSDSGETAGRAAAHYAPHPRRYARLTADDSILSLVPQRLDLDALEQETTVYFRTAAVRGDTRLVVAREGRVFFTARYPALRPPEMERVAIPFASPGIPPEGQITFRLEAMSP